MVKNTAVIAMLLITAIVVAVLAFSVGSSANDETKELQMVHIVSTKFSFTFPKLDNVYYTLYPINNWTGLKKNKIRNLVENHFIYAKYSQLAEIQSLACSKSHCWVSNVLNWFKVVVLFGVPCRNGAGDGRYFVLHCTEHLVVLNAEWEQNQNLEQDWCEKISIST